MASESDPLEKWRLRSTFQVGALRNWLYTEEVVEFKNQVWGTLAKDPLFSDPDGRQLQTLHQKRELAFRRTKRLMEYNFLSDDTIMRNPLAVLGFIAALLPFNSAMLISWQLSASVRGGGESGKAMRSECGPSIAKCN